MRDAEKRAAFFRKNGHEYLPFVTGLLNCEKRS
jgi:hypothetical protein